MSATRQIDKYICHESIMSTARQTDKYVGNKFIMSTTRQTPELWRQESTRCKDVCHARLETYGAQFLCQEQG